MSNLTIGLDFDGTIVTHDYPRVGQDVGSKNVLKRLQAAGHQFVLNTMRSGRELDEAAEYLREVIGIPLYGINENPRQHEWTESPKVYAHIYIDDAALGCPLIHPGNGERPYVDWVAVEELLLERGVINE